MRRSWILVLIALVVIFVFMPLLDRLVPAEEPEQPPSGPV